MSVKVEQLVKIYGQQHAVDGISFEIKSGEIVGFLGPNGAGKSTTMKMITCYISPTSGQAWVCGHDIYEESLEVRRKIGYLPEHNPLYLDMYVKEYLRFIGQLNKYKGNLNSRISELIALTGLEVEQRKKIGALSKGYRQRIGLAQALLHDPEVLILDEPTSGLDPNQIVEIRNLISEVGKQKTVILSTHILQEVQAMCSRIIIINKGKIVADQSKEELLQRSSGKVFLRVEFKNQVQQAALKSITGIERADRQGNIWSLQAADSGIREKLFRWAVDNGNEILEMHSEAESLEKIFQDLTQNNTGSVTEPVKN